MELKFLKKVKKMLPKFLFEKTKGVNSVAHTTVLLIREEPKLQKKSIAFRANLKEIERKHKK